MNPTGGSVDAFIAEVEPERRRRDAFTMLKMMREITGLEPELWGTIVGFGSCHYEYPTGNQGDMPRAAFSPRKASTTIYLMQGFDRHTELLERLGPHKVSKACLYLTNLEKNDLGALRELITDSFVELKDGNDGYADITITS